MPKMQHDKSSLIHVNEIGLRETCQVFTYMYLSTVPCVYLEYRSPDT